MSDHSQDHSQHLHIHITPLWVYFLVWISLMVLTGVTVAAATFNLGPLNIPLMLAIAIVKGSLVALFFMHLLFDDRFNLLLFLSAIGFIMIFFVFTMIDPMTRGTVNNTDGPKIVPEQFRTNNQYGLTEEYLNVGLEFAPAGSHGGDAHGADTHGAPHDSDQATDAHGAPSVAPGDEADAGNVHEIGHPIEQTVILTAPATGSQDAATTGSQDTETTGSQDTETTGSQDTETTGSQDAETTNSATTDTQTTTETEPTDRPAQ